MIPAKNINEFVKLIENDDDEIELHTFNNKVLFRYNDILFQSSLLNGTYPNTDQLVPVDFDIIYKVNLNEFYSIIDRAYKNLLILRIVIQKLFICITIFIFLNFTTYCGDF